MAALPNCFFQLVQVSDERPVVGLAGGHVARLPIQHNAAVDGLSLAAGRCRHGFGIAARVDHARTEDV